MITYWFIGGLALMVALLTLSHWAFHRAGREDGYEEGRADAYEEILDRVVVEPDYELELEPLPELTPGRHARTQPRQQAATPPVQDDQDQRPPWYTQIGTVLLPPSPAPALNGTADTGTMARVQLPDASTGAIRAVGDELVAKIERGELV